MKRSASVTVHTFPASLSLVGVQQCSPAAAKALPLEWILDPGKRRLERAIELQQDTPRNILERILSRVVLQEATEKNLHLKTDRRIAWITVKWAMEGIPECSFFRHTPPNVAATESVLHCRPHQVWELMIKERKYALGAEYSEWYDASGMSRPDVPKKPQSPVTAAAPQPQAIPFPKERRRA
jgi:hypothetical protein